MNLRDVATKIKNKGWLAYEAIIDLGLQGTQLSPETFQAVINEAVFLCDGLDETGQYQTRIADDLAARARFAPNSRIIVTTRPIGYHITHLKEWRHYRVASLDSNDAAKHLRILVNVPDTDVDIEDVHAFLSGSFLAETISKSPLLLRFAAALFLRNKNLGETRAELFEQVFKMLDDDPSPRKADEQLTTTRKNLILNFVGWLVISNPFISFRDVSEKCAGTLQIN